MNIQVRKAVNGGGTGEPAAPAPKLWKSARRTILPRQGLNRPLYTEPRARGAARPANHGTMRRCRLPTARR